jgi:hypothetical protein
VPAVSVVGPFVNDNGDTEFQLFQDGFQLGVILHTQNNEAAFRPHPDLNDINGFGSTFYFGPYLGPGGGFPGGLPLADTPTVTANNPGNTFTIQLSGSIDRGSGQDFGTWSESLTLAFDSAAQTIHATGTLTVTLDGTLASAGADLNLGKIASNFLTNVPRQAGPPGNTGDMARIEVLYSAGTDPTDPPNFTWVPTDGTTFPGDTSAFLQMNVVGQVNTVDTLALGESFQIAVARKPTLSVAYTASDPADALSAGLSYDIATSQDFASDNVEGVFQVRQTTTAHTSMTFGITLDAGLPPFPLAAVADALGNVVVFDPNKNEELLTFRPFDTAANQYVGQMSVALGDANNDGIADLIVATRGKRAGKVKVFDGAGILDGTVTLPTQTILVAFPVAGYKQGLTVASGDVNGDGIDDIAVATRRSTSTIDGSLLRARVVVYAGADTGAGAPTVLGSFPPIGAANDGLYITAGNVGGTAAAEVAISSSKRSLVKIFQFTGSGFTQLGGTLGDGEVFVAGNGDGQFRALDTVGDGTVEAITGILNPNTGAVELELFSSTGTPLASYSRGTGASFFALDAIDLDNDGDYQVMLARVVPGGSTTIELLNPTTGDVEGTLNSFLTLTGKVTIAGH